MDPFLIVVLGLVVMFILIGLHVPIGFAMGLVGFIGFASLISLHAATVKIGVIAYAHTVERLALTLDAAAVDAVRAVLPPGSRAIRCLRVHSAIGSDVSHVSDNIRLVATLPAAERAAIALACRRVAGLFSRTPDEGHLDDAALAALFRPWRRSHGGQDG